MTASEIFPGDREAMRPCLLLLAVLMSLSGCAAQISGDGFGRRDQQAYRYRLSSGLFALPEDAASVDWALVNNSASAQEVRVTVYEAGVGPKKTVPPGALSVTLQAGEVTHNANSVGAGKPFRHGFYYEVIVESNDLGVMPTVEIWLDHGNTAISGSRIGPTGFFLLPVAEN